MTFDIGESKDIFPDEELIKEHEQHEKDLKMDKLWFDRFFMGPPPKDRPLKYFPQTEVYIERFMREFGDAQGNPTREILPGEKRSELWTFEPHEILVVTSKSSVHNDVKLVLEWPRYKNNSETPKTMSTFIRHYERSASDK